MSNGWSPLRMAAFDKPAEATHIKWAMQQGATEAEAKQHWIELDNCERWANEDYVVLVRTCPSDMNPTQISGMKWLSIRRRDGSPVRNWQDLQQIKNDILGREADAVEVFPAESRKADGVNQYHLFGGWPIPIGFPARGK
jgi:hypothetical protein